MSSILSKIIAVSFVAVLVASTMYVFLTDNQNIYLGAEYPEYEIFNFGSYEDLNTYLQTIYSSDYNYNQDGIFLRSAPNLGTSDEIFNSDIESGGEDNDYSDTNIQELGVDEPDIVKTDGTYLYVVSNLDLYIILAYPPNSSQIISKITFNESDRPSNLFINDDKLAVITQSYVFYVYEGVELDDVVDEKIWSDTTSTHVFVYDISNRAKPEEIHNVEIEGYYSNARMIDDYIYVITTQYAYEPILYMDEETTYKPKISVDEKEEIIDLTDIYYIDSPDVSKTLTNIISFNIAEEKLDVKSEVFILGNPSTIYVSTENIFITSVSYEYDYNIIYEMFEEYVLPFLPNEAKNELNKVDTLSIEDYQKYSVSEWIIQKYVEDLDEELRENIAREIVKQIEKTIIHKISINKGDISYESQATVPGYIRNQFSISEFDGYLRVATTVNGWMMRQYLSSFESYNNVYVLDENLELVSGIGNIATGEEIYSVRFQETRCYLVTFEQIDPFFVIDLQDPRNPEILGELKIPGFSTYLHPYDENNVIGIGQEENSVKISLFNVEDVRNPKELSTYQIQQKTEEYKWSYSSALYEHKAFLFSKEKNLLIIPVSIDYKESAYVFNITSDNIDFKGIITHESEDNKTEKTEPWESTYWWGDYRYSIKRSLFIEDVIYTISDAMIKLNDIDTLNELNKIQLDI
jgi:uncharacterized secreted protein with C-terminal beta-propeller domain